MSAEDIAEEIESFVSFRHDQGSQGPEARKQAIAVYLQMRFGVEAASTFNEPRPEDWDYLSWSSFESCVVELTGSRGERNG